MRRRIRPNTPTKDSDYILERAYELTNKFAEETWDGDTYVLHIQDTISYWELSRLLKLTEELPHDVVYMHNASVCFCSTKKNLYDVRIQVDITKDNWQHKARWFLWHLNVRPHSSDRDYMRTMYALSILSGNNPKKYRDYWKPTLLQPVNA